jgi:hypothetical protein
MGGIPSASLLQGETNPRMQRKKASDQRDNRSLLTALRPAHSTRQEQLARNRIASNPNELGGSMHILKIRLNLAVLSLATLVAFLSGCGTSTPVAPTSPSTPASTTPFSVASITPAPGTSGVALNSTIQITFSAAANASTVNSTSIQVTDPNAVAGTVAYNASTNVATFTPATALPQDSTFTVTVSGVTSASGIAMSSAFTSKFATVTQTTTTPPPTFQYQATLEGNGSGNYGQVSVDAAGNTTVQLTGAAASMKFTVEFCPMGVGASKSPTPCMTLNTVTTDASGNASATTMFPQPGSWAGDFLLNSNSGPVSYETNIEPQGVVSGQVYMSTLQPQSTVDQGAFANPNPQLPLTSGTVTYANGSITFMLAGTSPNTLLEGAEMDDVWGDSNGESVGSGTSDSNGNLTFSGAQDGSYGDLFGVSPGYGNDNGFLGGFSVPPSSTTPAIQYQASLEGGNYGGQVSVDAAGNTTVQLIRGAGNTKFTIEFCPLNISGNAPTYITLGAMTTNPNGNGSATMIFPQPGSWAGDFELFTGNPSNTQPEYQTNIEPPSSAGSQVYMSTLQPESTVDQGAFANKSPQAPLSSGTVTYSDGSITFALKGTSPSVSFSADEGDDQMGDSNSYAIGSGSSDAGGNLTFTGQQDGSDGDLFSVEPGNNDNGFVGGFSVPQPQQ